MQAVSYIYEFGIFGSVVSDMGMGRDRDQWKHLD